MSSADNEVDWQTVVRHQSRTFAIALRELEKRKKRKRHAKRVVDRRLLGDLDAQRVLEELADEVKS